MSWGREGGACKEGHSPLWVKIEGIREEMDRLGQKSGSTCPLTLREQVLLGLEDGLAKDVGVIDKTHQQGQLSGRDWGARWPKYLCRPNRTQ